MSELSPQAQAVLDAAFGRWMEVDDIDDDIPGKIAAAALGAAVDQVVPETMKPDDAFCCPPVDTIVWKRLMNVRQQFLAIATELEGIND